MVGKIVAVGGFLIFVTAFAGLGLWQLDRAEEKRALFAAFEAGAGETPATGPIPTDVADDRRYSRLELAGRYASSRQVLLDWTTHEGRVGYQVLTPFKPDASDLWVLVNRGWIAGAADHATLPEVSVGEARRVIRGRIDTLPRPGLERPTEAAPGSTNWPRPMLYPTLAEIEKALALPIARYQLLLDADAADGYVRTWQPRSLTPENHVAYAVQWFAMSAVLAAIGIGLYVRSVTRRRRVGVGERQ